MDKHLGLRLRLTNKQVESWIFGNNSDDGLLDDQLAIFSPITRMVNEDGKVYYQQPVVTFGTPFSHINEYGNDIWVVEVTIHPIED